MMQLRRALIPLVLLLLHQCAYCQRILIKHDILQSQSIVDKAHKLGFTLVAKTSSLLVLEGRFKGVVQKSRVRTFLRQARSWPGVVAAEQDQPRYMHRPFAPNNPSQSGPGPSDDSCRDTQLPSSDGVWPEYMPYGMGLIQADSGKLPNSTADSGVIVCIIDSGIDSRHPDLTGNTLDGCKYEDSFAPAGCPFFWGGDLIGHGTHVSGTIAAQRNGVGVVGVIPGPAELYTVRVFFDNGDVNQGQGLVYGSTLILAYTQCEGRLAAQQAAQPDKNYRMVVSMSLGAPGPLTIERLFFREALSRGDIMFVASSGNNGSAPTMNNGRLSSDINPGNFPGAYPEVVSVAAVNCRRELAPFSQKHPSVDIAAPGVDIFSTASEAVARDIGATIGAFKGVNFSVNADLTGGGSQLRLSGTGAVTGKVVNCGVADPKKPCPGAKGEICLVQYDPIIRRVEFTPETPSGSRRNSSGPAKSDYLSDIKPTATAPTRYYCHLMEYCMAQGAKAMLIAAPAASTGYYGAWAAAVPGRVADFPILANFNCSRSGCDCWGRIKNKTRLPAVGLTLRQFAKLTAAMELSQKAGKPFIGTVDSRLDAFQRLSGTSMAVPHVSGGLARLWAAYPYCPASVLRSAIEQTAQDLGPTGRDPMFGHGLLQLEAAYDYLARQPCAKGPKQPLSNGIGESAVASELQFASNRADRSEGSQGSVASSGVSKQMASAGLQ